MHNPQAIKQYDRLILALKNNLFHQGILRFAKDDEGHAAMAVRGLSSAPPGYLPEGGLAERAGQALEHRYWRGGLFILSKITYFATLYWRLFTFTANLLIKSGFGIFMPLTNSLILEASANVRILSVNKLASGPELQVKKSQ